MARKRTNLIGNTPSVRETKVAIYIRVSTIHQVDKDSIPMQKKDLIAYCQLILGTDNYEIFEDAGYSGKKYRQTSISEYDGENPKGRIHSCSGLENRQGIQKSIGLCGNV